MSQTPGAVVAASGSSGLPTIKGPNTLASLEKLRTALLDGDASVEEKVEVNQRHLIDKILARYAGEYTVFRELLQNSNDAGATEVEIEFTSTPESIARVQAQRSRAQSLPPAPAPAPAPVSAPEPQPLARRNNPFSSRSNGFSLASWLLGDKSEAAVSSTSTIAPRGQPTTPPAPPTPVPLHGTVVYRNNGKPFSGQDWGRLRKIAEGNPDEQKIGFFGVGFYSLFSVCEEPFITSGSEFMGFFWRGDQLFTRKGASETLSVEGPSGGNGNPWTTFLLGLRDPAPFPPLQSFGRFLTTSLGFTSSLRRVRVLFDGRVVLNLDKVVSSPRPLELFADGDRGERKKYATKSAEGLFRMKEVKVRTIQLTVEVGDAEVQEGPGVPAGTTQADALALTPVPAPPVKSLASHTIYFRLATASFDAVLPPKLISDMERTTKKKPPIVTEVGVLYCNGDEYEAGRGKGDKGDDGWVKGRDIFGDLVPFPEQGRVVIGFATHQTTGCSMLLSGHLIPTVERESIDFVDRTLALYNTDLLSCCGLLARTCHDDDLAQVARLFSALPQPVPNRNSPLPPDGKEADELWKYVVKRGLHVLKSFAFLRPSTPHEGVGRAVARAFYAATPGEAFPMLSTGGVVPVTTLRIGDAGVKGFARLTPLVPDEVAKEAKDLVDEMVGAGIVKPMDVKDVVAEVEGRLPSGEVVGRVFSVEECVALLKWWCGYASKGGEKGWRGKIVGQARVQVAGKDTSKEPSSPVSPTASALPAPAPASAPALPARPAAPLIVDLAKVWYHINPKVIPPDLPTPDTVLPFEISHHFTKSELEPLLGWYELPISEWVLHVAGMREIEESPHFAEKVLTVVSRAFASGQLGQEARVHCVSALEAKRVVPTRSGMRYPKEAYFKNVTLFQDLPAVHFSNSKAVSEQFLKELGVREHVDLQIVLDRLGDLNWDHTELVKYLASVQSKLTESELKKLRTTPMFPKEGDESGKRFLASQLYFPLDELRGIGMPVINWPKGRLRPAMEEGKLLSMLGVQQNVPLDALISAAAQAADKTERVKLLNYLLDKHRSVYAAVYRPDKVVQKFLPVHGSEILANPMGVFADPQSALMGFPVLAEELRPAAEQFCVRRTPDASQCVERLVSKPPGTVEEGKVMFSWLSNRLSEFSQRDLARLEKAKIVPVVRPKSPTVVLLEPENVFFAGGGNQAFLEDLDVVDFGAAGNAFLQSCGVRNEPSPQDVARKVVRAPSEYLQRVGVEKYLGLLRKLATLESRDATLQQEMTRAPWLIGLLIDDESDEEKVSFRLELPGDIYLADDTVLRQVFKPLTAPMETILEEFYERLGSKWLARTVQEQYVPIGNLTKTTRTQVLQSLIHERAPLLMYDSSGRPGRELVPDAQKMLLNLIVSEVQDIEIRRTFNGVVKTQSSTACLGKDRNGTQWYLLVSGSQQEVDYFDVAQSLGRLLFKHPRLNDSLLLSTLLSTSLVNLKRKGFPVDRILNKEKARMQSAITQAAAAKPADSPPMPHTPNGVPAGGKSILPTPPLPSRQSAANGQPSKPLPSPPITADPATPPADSSVSQVLAMFPDADPAFVQKALQSLDVQGVINRFLDRGYDRAKLSAPHSRASSKSFVEEPGQNGLLDSVKSWLGVDSSQPGRKPPVNNTDDVENIPGGWNAPPASDFFSNSGGAGANNSGALQPVRKAPPRAPATSLDPHYNARLRTNLERSIKSLQSVTEDEFKAVIPNDPVGAPEPVPLSKEAYCSVLLASDLSLVAEVGGVAVFADKRVLSTPTGTDTLNRLINGGTVTRFVEVLSTLAVNVFGMGGVGAVKVWYDAEGATVAFNRNRTLFFNLRFFAAWHNNPSPEAIRDAMIYWFMVFCHEMAHNFVGAHDSEHEFYFSSFAEQYFATLAKYLPRAV